MTLISLLTGVYHLSRRAAVTLLHEREAWSKLDEKEVNHADATSWLLGAASCNLCGPSPPRR